jgi:hypothetical protein
MRRASLGLEIILKNVQTGMGAALALVSAVEVFTEIISVQTGPLGRSTKGTSAWAEVPQP